MDIQTNELLNDIQCEIKLHKSLTSPLEQKESIFKSMLMLPGLLSRSAAYEVTENVVFPRIRRGDSLELIRDYDSYIKGHSYLLRSLISFESFKQIYGSPTVLDYTCRENPNTKLHHFRFTQLDEVGMALMKDKKVTAYEKFYFLDDFGEYLDYYFLLDKNKKGYQSASIMCNSKLIDEMSFKDAWKFLGMMNPYIYYERDRVK